MQESDAKAIIKRRDQRFDGRFFFGVKTTRIYCRPICPARPKPENIVLFKSHSEAEKEGYRPCLRCRPELAPGTRLLDGTRNTVSRALRIIEERGEGELRVEALAASLGVTDRHLRRLFDEHLGASPIEIMITRRLHFARQMLRETALHVTEIAMASGFQSIRRFNEAFQERFRQSPSALRRDGAEVPGDRIALKMGIRLPYDWNSVLAYLRRHEAFGIERVVDGTYQRYVPRFPSFGKLSVSHMPGEPYLKVEFDGVPLVELRPLLARVRVLFDVDHQPGDLPMGEEIAAGGIRVPASFDPFETAVAILLGQLVSTDNARQRLKKLILRFGRRIGEDGPAPVYEFPPAKLLADSPIEEIGITGTLASAIRLLAGSVVTGSIDFASSADFQDLRRRFLSIRGIGPWSSEMIAMRCLADPDAFPASDLIVKRAFKERGMDEGAWASSRAYLTHCIWRDFSVSLSRSGRSSQRS